MDEEKIRKMYVENRKKIMAVVHKKNAFGNTESQIDFLENGKVQIHTHLTPSFTETDMIALMTMTIHHDPFISYDDLDEVFLCKLTE